MISQNARFQATTSSSQLYIIQLPINRIHPRPHNSSNDDANISFTFLLLWVSLFLFIVAFNILLIFIIFLFVVRPKGPKYYIDNLIPINQSSYYDVIYNFSIRSKNPNCHMGIIYQNGGIVSLSLKQQVIAIGNGKFPKFYHGTKKSMLFNLLLNFKHPKEIEDILKDEKIQLPLSLLINVPVKFKIWLVKSWRMKIVIRCEMTISAFAKVQDTFIEFLRRHVDSCIILRMMLFMV